MLAKGLCQTVWDSNRVRVSPSRVRREEIYALLFVQKFAYATQRKLL